LIPEDDILRPVPRDRPVARYAPSPTGELHLGNLRAALDAWRACRRDGGIFILRIEDIDTPRVAAGSEERMLDDLRWLGIDWDEGPDSGGPAGPYRQSERYNFYEAALLRLEGLGLIYRCTCSRKDLREASAPHAGETSVYPGICREKPREEQLRHPAGAAYRFRPPPDEAGRRVIEFEDRKLGRQRFDLDSLCGDFIVRRRDGLWAYQLACAVDDAIMGVTHVLRGADLLDSTPRQIALLRALGLAVPSYEHIPLVADAGGRRMSKRDGSDSLNSLRRRGATRDDVLELLERLPLVRSEN
jgi:glutamyl-tRNA synthetase